MQRVQMVPQGGLPTNQAIGRFGLTHGPVSSYLIDAGLISPEEAQIEAVTFSAIVSPAGQFTFTSPSARMTPGYAFLFNRMLGTVSNPQQDPGVLDLVGFNVLNEGRNKSVFKRPIPMALIICPTGPAHLLEWNSHFRFFDSADISVDWSIDATRYVAAAPVAEKRFYATLIGELVREELLPRVKTR